MAIEHIRSGKTKEQWLELTDDTEIAYKFIRIAIHYNTEEMQKYYDKFITDDGDIKFSSITVYSHILIAIIVAAWFLHNNKFSIKRDEDKDENVVEGGYKGLPGLNGRERRKSGKRKYKKERK